MNRLRLIVGCALAMVELAAVAAPLAAADTKGTLAIVNGIPGTKVDVCLNGAEIKSNLAYGGAVLKNVVGTGSKNLKFYARDPRTCRGTRLVRTVFPLAAGDDLTIVVTKKAPRIVTFDNRSPVFLGEIPPQGAASDTYLAWRNASEMPVNFRYRVWNPAPIEIPVVPGADAIFGKGQQFRNAVMPGQMVRLRARRPEALETLATATGEFLGSHRLDWILVGSKPGNARFVTLDRIVSLPSP